MKLGLRLRNEVFLYFYVWVCNFNCFSSKCPSHIPNLRSFETLIHRANVLEWHVIVLSLEWHVIVLSLKLSVIWGSSVFLGLFKSVVVATSVRSQLTADLISYFGGKPRNLCYITGHK
jgi:sensor histidine kinase YesM